MKITILSLLTILLSISIILISNLKQQPTNRIIPTFNLPEVKSSPTSQPLNLPQTKILENNYHIFQTFNNCGPASLSMALSYYGINQSQKVLGDSLRPYQVTNGDNDDKSVTLKELSQKAGEFGFRTYHRPNGDIEKIKKFLSIGLPVITRTTTKPTEDIGHFRVIKGYDDTTQEFIQDDSLQGKNLRYKYSDFNFIWEKFNYEYLVLVPNNKKQIAQDILGEEVDERFSWNSAVKNIENRLSKNPDNIYDRFNLSVALYNIGDYQRSVLEFEKVEKRLPARTLWYQIEPIQAYFELGNYQRVFEMTDRILNNGNRAFSEVYLIRGRIYQKQANTQKTREEFEKAVFYNKNLKMAQDALSEL